MGGRRAGAKDKKEQIAEKEKMSASPRALAGREGAGAAAGFRLKGDLRV